MMKTRVRSVLAGALAIAVSQAASARILPETMVFIQSQL